jgi:O-antigen/teichoic acid export membrane protein
LLQAWTTTEAAQHAAVVLALFGVGFLLNASVSIAYTLAVASGHTMLPLRVNLVALVGYVPGLYLATVRWGIVGSAWAWVALNLYFLLTLLPLVESRIARGSVSRWAVNNFLPFVARGGIAFGLAALLVHRFAKDVSVVVPLLACGATAVVYAFWGLTAVTPELQADVRHFARALLPRAKTVR